MKNIGLDFGTTNTIIAYYNELTNSVDKFESNTMENYIPSYLAISKVDGDVTIGEDAKSKMGNDEYDVYSKFKMLLHVTDPQVLENFDWPENTPKTPEMIVEQYIRMLFEMYCTSNNIKSDDIEHFTVTVPEIWLKDGNHIGRETLLKICQNIINKDVKLISEPVAASVYYSYQYHKQYNTNFKGHLLVCDFGGGTLDISLSELGDNVKILESSGAGRLTNKALGAAGVAYDDAVLQRMYEENQYKFEDIYEHFENLFDFEFKKISQKPTVDKALERYLRENTRNRSVFSVNGNKCLPSYLCDAFDKKIRDVIFEKLTEISGTFSKYNIDTSNPDVFRVVLVGGFCNFYLVKKTVMDFFHSEVSTDFRFDESFIDADKNLAIAKGAAVYSAGLVTLDTVVPLSLGVKTYDRDKKPIEKIYLEKGKKLEDAVTPDYSISTWISLNNREGFKKSMILFIDSETGHRYFELSPLMDYLPNPIFGNSWRVAFSMDENRCYHIHIEDQKTNHVNKFNLGDLLEKVK